MKSDFKDKVVRNFTIFVLLLIIFGGLLLLIPNYRRRDAMIQQNAELKAELQRRINEIDKLTTNQRRFRDDPEFIEKIARENRRVYPGELVFSFDDKEN